MLFKHDHSPEFNHFRIRCERNQQCKHVISRTEVPATQFSCWHDLELLRSISRHLGDIHQLHGFRKAESKMADSGCYYHGSRVICNDASTFRYWSLWVGTKRWTVMSCWWWVPRLKQISQTFRLVRFAGFRFKYARSVALLVTCLNADRFYSAIVNVPECRSRGCEFVPGPVP